MKTMSLSKSLEDYLETIYIIEKQSKVAKSVEISRMLNVSKPAVNKAMNELLKNDLITKELYGSIKLTKEGEAIAKNVYHKHTTICNFLIQLGVSEEIAEKDCCLIEHVISKETLLMMEKAIKNK